MQLGRIVFLHNDDKTDRYVDLGTRYNVTATILSETQLGKLSLKAP